MTDLPNPWRDFAFVDGDPKYSGSELEFSGLGVATSTPPNQALYNSPEFDRDYLTSFDLRPRWAKMTGNGLGTANRIYATPVAHINGPQSRISEIQRNISSQGQPIPIVYGHQQVGGMLFYLNFEDGVWTVGYIICLGEIEAYVGLLANGAELPASVDVTYYRGLTTQTVDATIAGTNPDYSDDMVIRAPEGDIGIAYVVLQYPDSAFEGWPQVLAEIQARKVWNPTSGQTEYSDNPSLHLADFYRSTIYGMGYNVDDASLIAAAAANDDDTGLGEVRRQSGLVLKNRRARGQWAQVLKTYAACYAVLRGDTVHLIPNRPAASSQSFDSSNIVKGSLRFRKRSSAGIPTVIRVVYTDTSQPIWREAVSDPAEAPGVSSGATPRRESRVSLPGINRSSQANREAIERLNQLQLSDLEVEWTSFDIALKVEIGDVVDVTDPIGLSAKLLRIIEDPEEVSPGRWRLVGAEYDPAAYSDSVATTPTFPDTNLPQPGPPAAVTGLTLGETLYQKRTGDFAARIDISWNASSSAFVTGYQVKVFDGPNVVWATSTASTNVSTSELPERTGAGAQITYRVEVIPHTALLIGDAADATIALQGKFALPAAPASLSGFEAGGEVRLQWPASADVDVKRYEIRYGITTGDWDGSTVIDQVDSLRLTTREVPPGEWRFYVKSIDSVFQYSADEATIDLTVTLDDDAFTAGALDPVGQSGALTNMHATKEVRGSGITSYYGDSGESAASIFGASPMNSFSGPLASHQTLPSDSEWFSEELDLDEDKSGTFQGDVEYEDLSGSATLELGLKPDAGSYAYGGLSQQGTARYAQLRCKSSGVVKINAPSGKVRADVVASEETGSDTSSAGGGTQITLSKKYSAARSIVITPEGTSARSHTFDNIQLDNGGVTTFDVYIFNASGSLVATPFRWQWKGV